MQKIILCGGPCSGKSTLQQALGREFPNWTLVPEIATEVISEELQKQKLDPSYIPIVPWLDYRSFGPLLLERQLQAETALSSSAEFVLLDRSAIDILAYYTLNDCEDLSEQVLQGMNMHEYSLAFFCEPIESYETSEIRREDVQTARKLNVLLTRVYEKSGIPLCVLPDVGLQNRVKLVRDRLAQ